MGMGAQPVYLGTDFDGMLRGYRQKIEHANALGEAIDTFLAAAFPVIQHSGVSVGGALADFLTSGLPEYIEALESQRGVAAPAFRNSPIERLAEYCKQRDSLQAQVDQAQEMIERAKGTPMADVMVLGANAILGPTQRQLDWYNEQISDLQREMESAEA